MTTLTEEQTKQMAYAWQISDLSYDLHGEEDNVGFMLSFLFEHFGYSDNKFYDDITEYVVSKRNELRLAVDKYPIGDRGRRAIEYLTDEERLKLCNATRSHFSGRIYSALSSSDTDVPKKETKLSKVKNILITLLPTFLKYFSFALLTIALYCFVTEVIKWLEHLNK